MSSWSNPGRSAVLALGVGIGVLFAWAGAGCGGDRDSSGESAPAVGEARLAATPTLGTLKGVPVPEPQSLGQFVVNRSAAIVLGKALFWDNMTGSDGQACASCHFHAGADHRAKNQLNPGGLNENPALQTQWNPTAMGGVGPNYTLKAGDFPFHRLANVQDRNSAVLFDSNDVVSSQGVFPATFQAVTPGRANDTCAPMLGDPSNIGGVLVRRVEPRNTPTVINAVFNFRNFWDGRANNHFNGVSPFGLRDTGAFVVEAQGGVAVQVKVDLENASLASQAVGPATNPFEMSCDGRTFADIGTKLLSRGSARPLALQDVDASDSVLGAYRHTSGKGLSTSYRNLVEAAFSQRFWDPNVTFQGKPLREVNFSLFWGLAIQLYEATLVSDDARFDRFLQGNQGALTAQEQQGLDVFQNKGGCIRCHHGPEFTSAGTPLLAASQANGLVKRMIMGDGAAALYDSGYYNIGVRPTAEDRGTGLLDPFGNPFSFARQAKIVAGGGIARDPFQLDAAGFDVNPNVPVNTSERDATDGAFKVPGLRNVELTGPYFHNGGTRFLEDVVAFYDRGGDRRGPDGNDTTGFGPNGTNLDADIQPLFLSAQERAALVAFLRSLTDERVRQEMAPFDHPSLLITLGHVGDQTQVTNGGTGRARDIFGTIPAVGAGGRPAKGLPALNAF